MDHHLSHLGNIYMQERLFCISQNTLRTSVGRAPACAAMQSAQDAFLGKSSDTNAGQRIHSINCFAFDNTLKGSKRFR